MVEYWSKNSQNLSEICVKLVKNVVNLSAFYQELVKD